MRKLNIAIVCDAINNYTGGGFISAYRFAKYLSKKGHNVIAISSKYPDSLDLEFDEELKIYRLPSFRIPFNKKDLYISYYNNQKIKKILMDEKIDIVHIMLPFPISDSAISCAKELGIPIVSHSHFQPENLTHNLPNFLKNFKIIIHNVVSNYISNFYRKPDVLICPTQFSKDLLDRYKINLPKFVISNGVDLNYFKKVEFEDILERFYLDIAKKRILFVGRLDSDKNLSILVKCASYLKKINSNFEICIVGDGNLKDELILLSKSLKVNDVVKFIGYIDNRDLVKFYSACDVFVNPSLTELESMVSLEAMSFGKPIVIANSKDSAARFFVKDNGFLFKSNSAKDLSKKINIILNDNNLYSKFSKNSLEIAKSRDINKVICDLEKVYFNLVRSK